MDLAERVGSRIVLALDIDINPYRIKLKERRSAERLNSLKFIKGLLAELDGLVAGVKVGIPMMFSLGLDIVEEIIDSSKKSYFFICDSKMADIGHINRLVAAQLFEIGFDALIIHAAIGKKGGLDDVVSLAEETEKGVLGLCAMTHPGASEHLNRHIDELLAIATSAGVDGFVLPATYPQLITKARDALPSSLIFSPGVGVQGADFGSAISAGADFEIIGRSIARAPSPAQKAKEILKEMRK
jgi:orotidine-5'-phosphate decarboxylase